MTANNQLGESWGWQAEACKGYQRTTWTQRQNAANFKFINVSTICSDSRTIKPALACTWYPAGSSSPRFQIDPNSFKRLFNYHLLHHWYAFSASECIGSSFGACLNTPQGHQHQDPKNAGLTETTNQSYSTSRFNIKIQYKFFLWCTKSGLFLLISWHHHR